MSKHTYTEKWYQAAHCILDADEIQRTEAKGLPYLIERLQFGNKPQLPEALIDVKLASLLPDRDPRGCFSKPMKDLNFVVMQALSINCEMLVNTYVVPCGLTRVCLHTVQR